MTAKAAGKSESEAGGSNETSPYVLTFEINRKWAGLPGAILTFKLRMYLSGELSEQREGTLGLSPTERLAALLNFRTQILADTLITEPGGFPDFPAATEKGDTTLRARAYEFFSRKDGDGYSIFALLVEDVVNEYWARALPSPTLPASAS